MNVDGRYTFIWDLDGTLIDSYKVIVESLFTLSKKYNLDDTRQDINRIVIAETVYAYIDMLANHTKLSREFLLSEYRNLNELRKDNIELIDNAAKTLRQINNLAAKNFIYTHRGKSTHYLLDKLKIKRYFTEVVTAENKLPRKPSGAGIRYLIDKYGLDSNYVYYVGDRNIDIDCAKDAGVKAILYQPADSYCLENGSQDIIVSDLYEILNYQLNY